MEKNMRFSNTQDALKNLQEADSLALENALGLFLDFCGDCDDSGRIDRLPVRDPVEFVKNLRKCNRIFLDIMKTRSPEISSEDASGRAEKQKEALQEMEAGLAVTMREIERAEAGVADIRADLNRRKAELTARQEKVREEESGLEKERADLARQSESLTRDNVDLQTAILDLRERIPAQQKEKEEKQAAKKEMEAISDSLNEEIAGLSKETFDLDNRIEKELKPSLQKAEQTHLIYDNREKELTLKMRETEEKNAELTRTLEEKAAACADLERKKGSLLEDINETSENLTRLKNEVRELEAAVHEGDVSRTERELEKRKQALTEARTRLEALELQCTSVADSNNRANAAIGDKEKELADLQAKWEELQERESQVKKKLTGVTARTKDIASVEERIVRLRNVSAALEADSRILSDGTGLSGFSVDNDVKLSIDRAEDAMKRLKKDIEDYTKIMNVQLNAN